MKILCLGNNTEETDKQTKEMCDSVFHGLLSAIDTPLTPDMYSADGWYHSSIYDIEFGHLLDISLEFDRVIMLDQNIQKWSHPDAFYNTVRLMKRIGPRAQFLNESFRDGIDFFENLVKENPSFCIFPFIELLVNYDYTTVCCRSFEPVTKLKDLTDYHNDPGYQDIRQKMLVGEKIPNHCGTCYKLEEQGLPSARQQETVEWANRLGITNLDQLKEITHPVYYEIRPSNKCNLQCRMCGPSYSHLIDKEYRSIGIIKPDAPVRNQNVTGFEIVDFKNLHKVYVAGGEPTLSTEFYDFLDKCINEERTDLEILVNTNGTNLNEKFKNQLKHFSNFQFVFSIDGFKDVNYYIRWPSEWDHIIDNLKYLKTHGHKITINTAVSIYNVDNLYSLFAFIDETFPGTLIHVSIVEGKLSPFRYPDPSKAIFDLQKIKNLNCYRNDRLFSDSIDGYIKILENTPKSNLDDFFQFNDLLDQSRGIKLAEYLPNLDRYRIA